MERRKERKRKKRRREGEREREKGRERKTLIYYNFYDKNDFFFYCPFRVGVKRQIRKASSMGWNSCVLSDSRVSPVSVNGEFIFKLPEILPRLQDSILPHYKREGRPDLFLSSRIPGGRLRHHFWL